MNLRDVRKSDVGRVCQVKYDDIGLVTGMIVEISDDNKDFKIYIFASKTLANEDYDQIESIGAYVTPNGILESRVKAA